MSVPGYTVLIVCQCPSVYIVYSLKHCVKCVNDPEFKVGQCASVFSLYSVPVCKCVYNVMFVQYFIVSVQTVL